MVNDDEVDLKVSEIAFLSVFVLFLVAAVRLAALNVTICMVVY